MRVLGIVPARAGSVRVRRKNLRPLGGRPLVEWVIRTARSASTLDRLVVSSDDPDVLALADRLAPGSALIRPPEFATAEAPAIAYVRHALAVEEAAGQLFDAVAILQPTSPFTEPADIDAAVALLCSTGADSVVTVVRVAHDIHPLKLKTLDGDRLLPYLEEERGRMAEADLPAVYVRNCAVYVSSRHTIDAGDLLGTDSRGYVMPRERSIDINDEFDFALAELLLNRIRGDAG